MFFVLYLADQIILLEMHTILVAKLVSFKKYKNIAHLVSSAKTKQVKYSKLLIYNINNIMIKLI